ncbi:MAG: methyltransferase [Lentisphaerae bacterium RIFOXYB12_FULL_65_16]|nr:MAG: methyltransferase [Lentisphaerae bacterium RIFOXYA12_64_32]OGV93988.1 MAG: methyltransferase [Lentisphaerae bacterium RIFOXYB12_FULL_65_16]
MTHKERFYATIERRPVDRPACWLGIPTADALPGLFQHFGVRTLAGLKRKLDDDIFPVELPYHSPTSDAIYMAFDFPKKGGKVADKDRALTAPGFFEDYSDPARVDDFPWPDPTKYIDPAECSKVVAAAPRDTAVLGVIWCAHFQDACAAFGMETALCKMLAEPDMFLAVIDRITDFYLKANEIFYSAAKGKLDAVLIGNDFGSQTALMLSPGLIREHVWRGTRQLVDQAKRHNVRVIHHSCGAIRDIIPDLIDMGVDVIHPIQARATGMEPASLAREFGKRVSFCGGVDVQELMVNGTPDQVRASVRELRRLFPTGLVISPSHEALLPDVPPANVEALFQAARE